LQLEISDTIASARMIEVKRMVSVIVKQITESDAEDFYGKKRIVGEVVSSWGR
jgi:hypothetical protein